MRASQRSLSSLFTQPLKKPFISAVVMRDSLTQLAHAVILA